MAFAKALISSFVLISLFCCFSEATDFLVGGKSNAWQIPSSSSDPLNKWAEANRFQIGDSLVWQFDGGKDSVLQVTRADYQSCNTSNPIEAHNGGNVTVKLDRSGPFYFISGAKGHCEKGEKLVVVVMSERRGGFFSISPAPSPMEFDGPAIAPTSSARGLAALRGGFVSSLVVFMVLGIFWGMIL